MSFLLSMRRRPGLSSDADDILLPVGERGARNAEMAFLRDVLAYLGKLDTTALELPPWPPEDADIDEDRADELLDLFEAEEPEGVQPGQAGSATEAERGLYLRWKADLERARAQSSPRGLLLRGKLETVDGWMVSEAECALVADALEALIAELEQDRLPEPAPDAPAACVSQVQRAFATDGRGAIAHVHRAEIEAVRRWALFHRLAAVHDGYVVGP